MITTQAGLTLSASVRAGSSQKDSLRPAWVLGTSRTVQGCRRTHLLHSRAHVRPARRLCAPACSQLGWGSLPLHPRPFLPRRFLTKGMWGFVADRKLGRTIRPLFIPGASHEC